jgi:hypothetical protein
VDVLKWTYLPKQKVDIELEITSFQGSDGRSSDPFGTSFEIYIDAPMLAIDESRLSPEMAAKLKPHATIPGRFVYTVDASRDQERKTGNGKGVKNADNTSGVSQAGERKTLPFVTSDITSAGEIVISSQMEVVEFFEKRFNVINELVEGGIKYRDGGVDKSVSRGDFVSFSIEKSGVRIGSMNVTADGHFALNLRAEYEFSWTEDPILLSYILEGADSSENRVFEARFDSLEDFYNTTVVRGESVILQE